MAENIVMETEKGVLILTFNRIDKKNALVKDMYSGLADAFERLDRDETLHCILIKANGDAFCAGNDITFFLEDYSMATDAPVNRFLKGLVTLRKPMVAAVQGVGVGIGLTILLHCDLVFAAEDIRLSAPFVRLGLVPELGSSKLLPDLIGHCRTMEIFLLGKVIKADDALAYGLVNAIVPIGQLHATALDAAQKLAALPAESVYETKRLARKPPEALSKRIEDECRAFMQRVDSKEAKDIFRSFLTRK
jgi:enoyl-CoA hydratase/carnithine racemase